MTREEAIKKLKNTAWLGTDKDREETEQAIDMAIEALLADTISREEAIHAIDLCRERKNKEIDELRTKWLEAEQRADRPKGEWIDKGQYAVCSNCGADSGTQFDGVQPIPRKTSFCPDCGADMRGEE